MKKETNFRPILFWEGFPVCGLLITKVVKAFPDLVVVATKPSVPFKGLEKILGKKIHWLENANDIWEDRHLFEDRNLIIHTGWWHAGWKKYSKYLKKKNNAKVVVVVDNNFKFNIRQFLGAVYFRIFMSKRFDAVFVPGREGVKLLKFLGCRRDKIHTGNYGAFEEIFFQTKPINERKNQFLFVGQLIKRKGVDIMIQAFREYRKEGGSWNLKILGDGPMEKICQGPGIVLEGFTQPHLVSSEMNDAKVLVLVSREEHWGTVVCEAAACGMGLITSRYVGSSSDLVRNSVNGIELSELNPVELKNAFHYFESFDDASLLNMAEVSKGIARGFDSNSYLMSFKRIVSILN